LPRYLLKPLVGFRFSSRRSPSLFSNSSSVRKPGAPHFYVECAYCHVCLAKPAKKLDGGDGMAVDAKFLADKAWKPEHFVSNVT